MATMRVDATVLEHILDFPEGVKIEDIQRDGVAGEPRTFAFVITGTDPETGEDLGDGVVDAVYTQDDDGIHFEGFTSR